MESLTQSHVPSRIHNGDNKWWLFCLTIVVVKFLLLAVDPGPQLYLGDSLSYIWTALSGWIPEDRSYFYGYVIRFLSVWNHSLTPLLLVQVFAGVVIAIIVAWICRVIFGLSDKLSFLFGGLCAIDPLQLAWERYVMTETLSLLFYALLLQQSFVYLRRPRLAVLVLVQFLSVITIGFRMTFLIVMQVMAVALPLIAFFANTGVSETAKAVGVRRLKFLMRPVVWKHLVVSFVAMLVLDQGYQRAYGLLAHREPAHLYGTGYFLLSIWAPAIQPQDAADPRLAEIIEHGGEFDLRTISLRNAQRFAHGGLIDRWSRAETDYRKSSEIAARTALTALWRHPVTVLSLGARTYFDFWSGRSIRQIATLDLGGCCLTNDEVRRLANNFHWAPPTDLRLEPASFTKWYYIVASPYYFVVLASPLLALVLLFIARNKAHAWLLFIHTTIMFTVIFLLSIAPITRYLQPLSLLTLLIAILTVSSFSRQRRPEHS